MWTPKNEGHLVCKNAVSSQNLQILCYNYRRICKFLKMYEKRAKICNLYVKFDITVEKRGSLGVDWEKKGVIGCKISIKNGVYWQALDMTYGSVLPPRFNHHEPIHIKFGVWGFFIMFYWILVMKMLKCKKENLMMSHFSTLLIAYFVIFLIILFCVFSPFSL